MDHISPTSTRPMNLMSEIKVILTALPFVSDVYLFGSLVGEAWDRWSDIDMIVVTGSYKQFWETWQALHAAKPMLHHHPLSEADPSGGHILGNVFVDESVFHCLDLNFLTKGDHETPGAMSRFGRLKRLHHDSTVPHSSADHTRNFAQKLTPDEKRISIATHFTKKHAKRVLRGQSAYDDLQKSVTHLKGVMQDYPDSYIVPSGNIGEIARIYIAIADKLLTQRDL